MSIAKHSLSLSLDNKEWFKHVYFEGRDSLSAHSQISLKTLWGLSTLSFGMELLFALVVLLVSTAVIYYPHELTPWAAFVGLTSCFLVIFIIKRILIFNKYGRRKHDEVVISNEQITIAGAGLRQVQKESVTINKNDIREVIVSYTYREKHKRYKSDPFDVSNSGARLRCIEIVTQDGNTYALDDMRVPSYNLLYLLLFFDYPLQYIRTAAGGMRVMFILLVRVLSLVPFGNACIYALSKIPNPFQSL